MSVVLPIRQKEVKGSEEGWKVEGIYIPNPYNLTHTPLNPKSKHSNLKIGQCYRNIQLLSSDSIPTVSDWMLNFMQSLQIPGKQAGLP